MPSNPTDGLLPKTIDWTDNHGMDRNKDMTDEEEKKEREDKEEEEEEDADDEQEDDDGTEDEDETEKDEEKDNHNHKVETLKGGKADDNDDKAPEEEA